MGGEAQGRRPDSLRVTKGRREREKRELRYDSYVVEEGRVGGVTRSGFDKWSVGSTSSQWINGSTGGGMVPSMK